MPGAGALVIQGLDRHPMGEQRPRGIELLTADAIALAIAADSRLERQGVLAAALRPGIADAPAVEHGAENQRLLSLAGGQAQQLEHAELILRDLPQRRVGGADDAKHFGDGFKRNIRATEGLGNADAAQAAAGEQLDFGPRQFALLVAAGGLLAGNLGQFVGGLQGFGVIAQDLGRQQQRRAVEVAGE